MTPRPVSIVSALILVGYTLLSNKILVRSIVLLSTTNQHPSLLHHNSEGCISGETSITRSAFGKIKVFAILQRKQKVPWIKDEEHWCTLQKTKMCIVSTTLCIWRQ